jgi:hypothetical protein
MEYSWLEKSKSKKIINTTLKKTHIQDINHLHCPGTLSRVTFTLPSSAKCSPDGFPLQVNILN